MKVYRLKSDFDYGWVNCAEDDMNFQLNRAFNGDAEIDRAQTIRLSVSKSRGGGWLATDSPYLAAYGPLLLSDRAIDALRGQLDASGYLLNANLDGDEKYKIFMCGRILDAIDQGSSELERFKDGMINHVTRFELDAGLLEDADIFRLLHQRSCIFVSESFFEIVQRKQLYGFVFEEIWSSGAGGVQLSGPILPVENVRGEFAKSAAAKRKALRRLMSYRSDGQPPEDREAE